MAIWRFQNRAVPSNFFSLRGGPLNFRRLIQPMGIRFLLFMVAVFELFQLTAYLPASWYWPSRIIAIGIGLLFWRLMLYLAKVDQ